MYMYIHVCTCTYIHVYMYIHVCTCTYIKTCTTTIPILRNVFAVILAKTRVSVLASINNFIPHVDSVGMYILEVNI